MFISEEIVLSGFGGQGILSMGQILAYAAMLENKEVSWMPSYGPEMRGGTANCIVILSERKISSPIVSKFDTAIIFNQPSLDKFENEVKQDGLLFFEESALVKIPVRNDIEIHSIPAVQEAQKLGKKQVANMIMLGAYLERKPIVKTENILLALKKALPERHHHLLQLNEKALEIGKSLIKSEEKLIK